MSQRRPRQFAPDHLAAIRRLPCIACLDNISTEACHIRYSDSRIAKVNAGIGQKPDDKFTVPLCGDCHRKQHTGSERKFWASHGIDPILIALALYAARDTEEMELIVRAQHPVNILAGG